MLIQLLKDFVREAEEPFRKLVMGLMGWSQVRVFDNGGVENRGGVRQAQWSELVAVEIDLVVPRVSAVALSQ